MANRTEPVIVPFQGEFNARQLLEQFKAAEAQMKSWGAKSSAFGKFNVDVQKAETLIAELEAQTKNGFDTKGIDNFSKKTEALNIIFSKMNTQMEEVTNNSNLIANAGLIEKLKKEWQQATAEEQQYAAAAKMTAARILQTNGVESQFRKNIVDSVSDAQALDNAFDNIYNKLQRIAEVNTGNIFGTSGVKEYLTGQTSSGKKSTKDISQIFSLKASDFKYTSNGKTLSDTSKTAQNKLTAMQQQYAEVLKKMIQDGTEADEAEKQFKTALNNIGLKLGNSSINLQNIFSKDKTEVLNIAGTGSARSYGNLISAQQQMQSLNSAQGQLSNGNQAIDDYRQKIIATTAAQQAYNKEKNNQVSAEQQARDLIASLSSNFSNLTAQESNSVKAMRQMAQQTSEVNNTFGMLENRLKYFFSATSAFRALSNAIRTTFNDVESLDKSFSSIAMVTDKTVSEMWDSYSQYADIAKELGQTTKDTISASALFYQQGLETDEALELTQDTMKLATLSGADFTTATSEMTAALRAFHMDMDEGSTVTDVYSELAANAAASVNDIAYALSKTGSIAESAGMEFKTTSAFLTKMIETTQEAPENIGTALKTIIARFTELKENVDETDSEFDDLNFNDVDEALKSVNINLKDSTGQFRDTDDVLMELSSKWDSLDRNTQRYIATTAAGSRQQSRFIALMEDNDRLLELVDTAYDSAGKSTEQYSKYADTLENKLNKLKTTWEEFRVKLLDSDTLKNAVDLLQKIVDKITQMNGIKLAASSFISLPMIKKTITSVITSFRDGYKAIQNGAAEVGHYISNKVVSSTMKTLLKKFDFGMESITTKINGLKVNLQKAESDLQTGQNLRSNSATPDRYDTYINNLTQKIEQLKQKISSAEEELQAKTQSISRILSGGLYQAFSSLSRSLSTFGLMMFSGADATDAFKMAAVQLAMQVIPQLISKILLWLSASLKEKAAIDANNISLAVNTAEKVANAGASNAAAEASGQMANGTKVATAAELGEAAAASLVAAAIAAIAVALGAAIIVGKQYSKELKNAQSISKQLEKTEERLTLIQEKFNEAQENYKTTSDQKKDLEDLIDTYNEYYGRLDLTDEQQEELNETMSSLNENYSSIILYYDEENEKMEISNSLLQNKIDLLEKEAEAYQKTENVTQALNIINEDKKASQTGMKTLQNLVGKYDFTVDDWQNAYDSNGNFNWTNYTAPKVYWLEESFTSDGRRTTTEKYNETFLDSLVKYSNNELTKEDLKKNIPEVQQAMNALFDGNIDEIEKLGGEISDAVKQIYDEVEAQGVESYEYFSELYESYKEQFQNEELFSDENQNGIAAAVVSQFQEGAILEEDVKYYNQTKVNSNQQSSNEIQKILDNFISGNELDSSKITFTTSELGDAIEDLTSYAKGMKDDWEDLDEGTQDFVEWMGYDESTYEDFLSTYESADTIAIASLIKAAEELMVAESNGEDVDKYKSILKSDEGARLISQISDYQQNDMGSDTPQESEAKINEIVTKLQNLFEDYGGTNEDFEYFKEILDLNDPTKFSKEYESIFGIAPTSDMTNDIISAYNEAYKTISENIDNSALASDFVNNLRTSLANLDVDDQTMAEIIGTDWSDYDLTTETLDEWIDRKIEGLNLDEETEETLKAQLQTLAGQSDVIDTVVNSEQQVKELSENITTTLSTLHDDSDDYVSAITEQINDGHVTLDTYIAMLEHINELGKDSEDYFTINDGKITGNTEAIKQLYKEQILAQKNRIDQQKTELDLEISKEKVQLAELEVQIASCDAGSDFSTITWEAVDGSSVLGKVWLGIAEVIQSLSGKSLSLDSLKDAITSAANLKDISKTNNDEVKEALETEYEQLSDTIGIQEKASKELEEQSKTIDDLSDVYWAGFQSDIQDELDDTTDAEKDAADAAEELADAIKELKEAWEGTGTWSSDSLENLNAIIKTLEKNAERAKDALDNLSPDDNTTQAWNDYTSSLEQEMAGYEAYAQASKNKAQVYEEQLSQLGDKIAEINKQYASSGYSMDTNVEDMYSIDSRTGKMIVDYDKLYDAKMNDDLREQIEELAQGYNEELDNYNDYVDKKKDLEDEFNDYQDKALSNITALEDEVKSVLEEKYQDELEDLQDKYDAMEEADNDYYDALKDAIDKQRELREQEDSWNDLAEKEKKYSLMARDTSGSNQAEVQSLGQEIEDDRQDLLDSTVDNILELLKEKFDEEAEEHEEEIEYQQTLIDEEALTSQAVSIIAGWESTDDALAFFMANDPEFEKSSEAKQEELINGWEEQYQNYDLAQAERNTTLADLEANVEADAQEILSSAKTTLEDDVTIPITETINSVKEDIKDAIDAVADALEEVNEDDDSGEGEPLDNGTPSTAEEIAKQGYSNITADDKYSKAYNNASSALAAQEQYESKGMTVTREGNKIYLSGQEKNAAGEAAIDAEKNTQKELSLGIHYQKTAAGEEEEQKAEQKAAKQELENFNYSSDTRHAQWRYDQNGASGFGGHDWKYFDSEDDLYKYIKILKVANGGDIPTTQYKYREENHYGVIPIVFQTKELDSKKYSSGGLVDYTGPAWVDGTKSQPEAFLSSEDTQRIGEAAKLLSNLPILSSDVNSSNITQTQGDTSFEININIESISDDYDVEDMIEKMKTEIVNASNEIGTNVILKK